MMMKPLPMLRYAISKVIFLADRTHIISYPNSGRTWLRVMLAELGARPRFFHAESKARLELTASDMGKGIGQSAGWRVLFLVRDPRDTVVSNYAQVTKRQKLWEGDLKGFIRHPRHGIEKIIAFHLAYIAASDRFANGFHVEAYESMRADTEAALARIASFLRIPFLGEREIAAIAEASRFEVMQQKEQTGELFANFGSRFTPSEIDDPAERKVRRGKIGGYREDMDEEDIAYCDDLLAQHRYDEIMRAALRPHPAP